MNQIKKVFSLLGVIALISFILITSCKKDVLEYKLSGKVYDPQFSKGVDGAKLSLKASKVQSGVYNPSYVEIASTITSSNGSYEFIVEHDNVSGYRLDVTKNDYFDQSIDIKTESLQKESGLVINSDLLPIAYIQLIVKNTSPQAADDKIQFRFSNVEVQCKDCWNNDPIIGIGPSYSFKETKVVTGEKKIKINWVVTKNGTQHTFEDIIETKAFDTITYNINY